MTNTTENPMASHNAPPKIYLRNKAGRQVAIVPGYWTRQVWAGYAKKCATVAVLGLLAGGLVAYFN